MQNDDRKENKVTENELKSVDIDQEKQPSAMTVPSPVENPQVSSSQPSFRLDVSGSDDDEVSEVDSFILDADDPDPLEPNFLLPQSMEGANLQTVTVDPETHARLEALLEAAGIGKLSTADGKALTDPEVLRKLTSSVSCALDEAAQALHRMRAEQQNQLGNTDSQRSLAEACSDGDVPTVRKLLREGGSVHETTEEGDSLLSLACSAGYYELAQVLLAMKANVEDRGIKGDCTPLMEAASGGYVDIVKLLIAHGADVNAQSSAGNTPLHYAACGGYEEVVQVLIDAGANVEQHNENGHTPLMEASSAGHVGVAQILLNSGAGINTHSNEFKESALTLACYKGHLDMVKFLLEAGADQEHKTDEMHTALMEASMDGHVEVAKLLLDSGAQVNMPADSFESPLTLAACGGHVELANLLIERGANLEEVNDEGYTPLMEAAREGHEEMVALLLAHDADINAQTEETQETALTLACCGGFLDVADFLITAGADIELGCSTPLMEAAQEGHLELVKYLLKANANVSAQTGTGDTALTYACENGHTDVAEVLLQHGAELEHESEGGRTPLMKAARAGHLCTVQFLLHANKGADVNRQTTTNDHTVLSLACAGGHLAVVELLLAQGADPAHKLKDGSTMVIEAAKGGHTQVVKLLLEYPNRMLMNPSQDLPLITAAGDSHLVESRVPIHGLANIVPPSEPDAHPARPNNLTTTACEHPDGTVCKRKAHDKDMNIPIKAGDQPWQQKSLAKKPTSTGNVHNVDPATKTNKTANLTTSGGDLSTQLSSENGVISDLLHDDMVDLKAGERLEAIISNVMAKELQNTTSTREEQILRKQQILEELQKVERELQEKAQQQLLITAQHQQQQHQQLQQALQTSRQPLHKVLQKQLEEQRKKLPISSHPLSPTDMADITMSNNLDKLVEVSMSGEVTASKSSTKTNMSEGSGVTNGNQPSVPLDRLAEEKQMLGSLADKATNLIVSNGNVAKGNGGEQSRNGAVQSHNGSQQSSIQQPTRPPPPPAQPIPQLPSSPQAIPLPQPPTLPTTPAPPKPPQLLPIQQHQLEQQLQQLQLQQQQPQPQQQVLNQQPFNMNEIQRHTLHNLIQRQQQEAQQLAQQASLQFPQLQLTPQQQDHLFQVLSQQQFTQQQLQQAQQAVQQQQQQQQQQQFTVTSQQQPQQPNLLPPALAPNFSPTMFNPQQQQLLIQQQHFLQQQLQQIKPPVSALQPQKPVGAVGSARKTRSLLPLSQLGSPDPSATASMLGIETTPPPSTPLTPNPSPASPESISPLYAPIDLDAQTESNHDTALTLACAGGHSELVTLLLSKGSDIEHRDKKGFTPLILAATAGHVDVVEILLEHAADIEAQSERTKDTPLSLACSGGRYEVVELLLSRGANKEHRNVSDYTPLSLAASGGFVNIIKLLLSHGAEINSRTGSKLGISPLMLAAMNGHTAAVKLLLDMGSDINAQIETNRNTALTLACFQGRHEVVSLLVDRRANIEHRAKTGLTPLMEAASGGYVEVGRVLLDKGADVNAPPVPSSRDTALTIAADKGHYRFVELLLSRHAAVDVKNKKGNSPLWLACHGGHLDVVQLMVTAGADIDSQDNRKVSCLMASFRKGHIKVVKWMVKHVNQFPSDTELSRYIATITDKELQKKCQQCMEIIVSAKDRQAAEANKNATDLLEELDKERRHEENRKAAAAKKREKKKKKKKEKQVTKEKEPSVDSKNSSPEPESEDSQPQEVCEKEKEEEVVIQPPTATVTSTLGLSLPTSDPIYTKAKGRNNKKVDKLSSKTEVQVTIVEENNRSMQDENRDPRTNKLESTSNVSKTESKKNKRNRREKDRVPTIDKPDGSEGGEVASVTPVTSVKVSNKGKQSTSSNKKKKGEKNGQVNCVTAIGDLDDFGNLPSISDRDMEKLRKNVEKTKISSVKDSHFEKGHGESNNPHVLSVKTSPALANSPKRGQKKEDGWKEVVRKSKKVQVPASAISRVIGRGGCNINAIREVSGANIDVEKNKGSGERVITIKGSADATRQAHALITALVTDPDKDLLDLLPKSKNKQAPVENKSLYFIPPTDNSTVPAGMPGNQGSGGSQQQKSASKTLAPRLQQQAPVGTVSRPGNMSQPSSSTGLVWGNAPSGSSSPRRNSGKVPAASPYPVPGMAVNGPMTGDKSTVTRQLFAGEKRGGFGSPNAVTTVAMSGMSAVTRTTPSSPTFNVRPDVRMQQPNRHSNPKTLVPGTVKLLQRPSSAGSSKHEPQPLPIIPNQSTTTSTTHTITSSNNSLNMSSSGEFSPFNNLFSNAADQLLVKKDDMNERMNFASVAAAGVVPPFTGNTGMSQMPSSTDRHVDPALQAKAPGFKPPPGPRMMMPQDMAPGFKGAGFPMPQQMMDMNMPATLQAMYGFQGYPQPQVYSGQSPNVSPRSSQSSTAGLSPRSNSSSFESQPQKEEYTTPNQPMTLPKISSSLNPNAPDFTSRTGGTPVPGGPPNLPGSGFPAHPMYQQALAQQLLSVFNMGSGPSPGSPGIGSNQPPGGPPCASPGPSSQDPLGGNQQEFYQNMANLMQQFAIQNQTPGSPGAGSSFVPPPRPFSPLQGRPSSAPSMGGVLPKEATSPTPIGPPRATSPLPPSTPPMLRGAGVEDRRQPRPIGGERMHKKATGPPSLGPGNMGDFGDSFWSIPSPDLNMDWSSNSTSIGVTSATLQTSVMSTSVISGGNMSTSLSSSGDGRPLNLDNHSPSQSSMDDLGDQNFPHYVQSSGLPSVPLFNGVGPYPSTGFGQSPIPGTGDGMQAMWGNPTDTPEDLQDTGMWNWNK